MPYVILRTSKKFFEPPTVMTIEGLEREHLLLSFSKRLTIITAIALTVPGTEGQLTEKDVETDFREFGPFDVHNDDVEIIVLANRYDERLSSIETRMKIIEEMAQQWIETQPEDVAPHLREIKSLSAWTPLVLGGAYGKVELWKTHRIYQDSEPETGDPRLNCRLCKKHIVRRKDMSLEDWKEQKRRFLTAHYPFVEDIM